MGNKTTNHRRKVLDILKRRLQQRELQAASYGLSVEPFVKLEIEDLVKEIRTLEWEMARFAEDRMRARSEHTGGIDISLPHLGDSNKLEQLNLNGKWMLEEIYDFGRTTGEAHFFQKDNNISGFITIHDIMDDGENLILQQDIIGTARARTIFLYGTHIQAIKGRADDYELDQWIGIIKSKDLIEGVSEDIDGTTGKFTLKRQDK